MKIGKDEVGLIGIIGLILVPSGAFLAAYEFLSGGVFLLSILGIVWLLVGSILYYMDLLDYRKKKHSKIFSTV